MKIKFYRSEDEITKGWPCARVLEYAGEEVPWAWEVLDQRNFIGQHLMDILWGGQARDEVLQELDDVASGKMERTGFSGNAWSSLVVRDGVTFYFDVHDGEPNGGRVSLAGYRIAMEAWLDFLADKDCMERIVDLPD